MMRMTKNSDYKRNIPSFRYLSGGGTDFRLLAAGEARGFSMLSFNNVNNTDVTA